MTPLASVFRGYCLFVSNFVTMGRLTADDCSLKGNLCTQKGWGSRRMMNEFRNKTWNHRAIDKLIKKIYMEFTTVRKPGSGCQKWVRTNANIEQLSK